MPNTAPPVPGGGSAMALLEPGVLPERHTLEQRLPNYTPAQLEAYAQLEQQAPLLYRNLRSALKPSLQPPDSQRIVLPPHPTEETPPALALSCRRALPILLPRQRSNERGSKCRRKVRQWQTAATTVVAHIDHDEQIQATQVSVENWLTENGAPGTYNTYEPKKLECDDFCMAVYGAQRCRDYQVDTIMQLPPHLQSAIFSVTPHKAYAFIFYHAHRPPKPTRRAASTQGNGVHDGDEGRVDFDVNVYNEIIRKYGGNQQDPPDPPKCLGFSQVNIYRCTVRSIHLQQKALNINSYSWVDDINTGQLQNLMKKVRKRQPILLRRNAEEKIDHQLAPFYYVKYLNNIEREFFRKGVARNKRTVFSSLRNQFTLLMTLTGLIRGESMEQADLSDLLDFLWKGPMDPHDQHILIMQICQGKTNDDKKLWGRALRHRDATMCAIGALALYLWYRFDVCGEWKEECPDFRDNKAWFFIKLLVSSTAGPNCEEPMDIKNYATVINDVFDAVGVISTHRAHFGRKAGPFIAELAEVDPRLIMQLGLWAMNQQEECYSAMLPFPAMRALAGHRKEAGGQFVLRQTKPASAVGSRLRQQIFPFLEAEREALELWCVNPANEEQNTAKNTAKMFMNLLDNLCDVLLQDVAVMMNEENGIPHSVFREELFQLEDFALYCEEMKQHCQQTKDPAARSVAALVPGLNARFDSLHAQQHIMNSNLTSLISTINQQPQQMMQLMASGALNASAAFAETVSPANSTGVDEDSPTAPSPRLTHNMPPGTSPALCVACPEMAPRHDTLHDLWHEYFGTGRFEQGAPIEGGFAKLEESRESDWRKKYSAGPRIRFSKIKRIIGVLQSKMESEDVEAVLTRYNGIWEVSNKNESNMIQALQSSGEIQVKTRRKRKSTQASTAV